MLPLYKALGGFLLGLIAFIVPIPVGGDALFVHPARLAVFLGIAFALLVFFAKGRAWLSTRLRLRSRPLQVVVVIIALSAAVYLGLWLGVDTPNGIIIGLEFVAYLVLAFCLAVLLSIVGALAVAYGLEGRGGHDSKDHV